MRVRAERVEFSREQLIEIGLGVFWQMNDDGARGDVAEALRVAAEQARESADEVEEREQIDEAHEVAHHDLVKAEAQALGIGDAQFAKSFTERLPAPEPFEDDVVSGRDDEVRDDDQCLREVVTDDTKPAEPFRHAFGNHADDERIGDPREAARERSREAVREDDSLRRADAQFGGVHLEKKISHAKTQRRKEVLNSFAPLRLCVSLLPVVWQFMRGSRPQCGHCSAARRGARPRRCRRKFSTSTAAQARGVAK